MVSPKTEHVLVWGFLFILFFIYLNPVSCLLWLLKGSRGPVFPSALHYRNDQSSAGKIFSSGYVSKNNRVGVNWDIYVTVKSWGYYEAPWFLLCEDLAGKCRQADQNANVEHIFAGQGKGKPRHELGEFKPPGYENETNNKEQIVTRGIGLWQSFLSDNNLCAFLS